MTTFEQTFSQAEQEAINFCIKTGQFDSILSALDGVAGWDCTPEKEKVIQQLLNEKRPVSLDGESAVRAELERKEVEENYRIETPEQEAEWQAKFDAEKAEKEAKQAALNGVVKEDTQPEETTSEIVEPVEDLSEFDLSKEEVMAELKKKNIPFKPAQKKAELVSLLEAAV